MPASNPLSAGFHEIRRRIYPLLGIAREPADKRWLGFSLKSCYTFRVADEPSRPYQVSLEKANVDLMGSSFCDSS